MPTLFDTAAAVLMSGLKQAAGATVTCRRGDAEVVLTAARGTSRFEADRGDGAIITWESTDFLITAADYDFGAGAVQPQSGDTIEDAAGVMYEVSAPPGEKVCQPLGPGPQGWRIHSKVVSGQ